MIHAPYQYTSPAKPSTLVPKLAKTLHPTRWSTTLSSKVNLHHIINFRAVSKDKMAPTSPQNRGGRNPRSPPCTRSPQPDHSTRFLCFLTAVQERCPPRQQPSMERLKAKVKPLLIRVTVETIQCIRKCTNQRVAGPDLFLLRLINLDPITMNE